ncbi:ribosomal protein S6 kinase alpha-5-like isoform X2 [Nylanderia fulva]|uniref:ribosomal protein S6 kinase alpha-5-like isoform X2 n=1 Tax=Nylanderia fulva TaxID=613905 RepID=UPI0010FB9195|nr:ribosomal protein S6 kinase alpha-5-like isoform X2 [Nylanderia fulva]
MVEIVNLADSGSQKVDMTDFDILKILGTGAYGTVYLVRKRMGADCGQLYAMKLLKKASIVQKKKTTEHTKTERQILEAIRDSPFLITLYYAFQTNEMLCLILDYVPGGEMFTHLYNTQFAEREVRIYVGEIVLALERLHELGIIYRDIKLENILLDRDGHLVLTDFGLSKEFLPHERNGNARTYSFCGTIEYMAPEVVRGGSSGHDIAVDWWSVGVLTFELLTGTSPFSKDGYNTQQEISKRILKDDPPPKPSNLSDTVWDFITRLLVKDPRQRLGGGPRDAKELKEHPFFMDAAPDFTWEALENKRIKPPIVPVIKHELDTSNFSDEFTNMNVAESLARLINGNNTIEKHFRGYSYVAPSILFSDNVVSRDIFGNKPFLGLGLLHGHQPRPSFSSLHEIRFDESTFFQTYELDRTGPSLGHGSFSICLRCRHRDTRQEYAVKIISRRVDCDREENVLRACQRHSNVVKLIEVHHDRLHTYIVMELLAGGELSQRRRPFSEWQARRIMRQLSSALRYMHSNGIVHRDLKPENIIFLHSGEDSPVKIVDFGFARMKTNCEPLRTPCCTLPYAAPEIVARQGYDESCDMWSLGTILYFLLSPNDPPFRMDLPDLANRIKTGEIDFDAWTHVSPGAIDVMKGLLIIEPKHRLTARDLKYHPWIVATTKDALLPPMTPIHDVVVVANHGDAAASSSTEQRESFRLRAVDAAKLAQRRKNKRSTSSSSSRPSSSSSSPPLSSNQPLRPASAQASTANHTSSTSSPSVFDYTDEVVSEYLSSLSSSSSSDNSKSSDNSPLTHSLLQKRALEDSKRGYESADRPKKRRRRDDADSDNSSSSGPMTRSRRRKLEQLASPSGGDAGSDVSVESYESSPSRSEEQDEEASLHRKHKAGKRSKRLPTITVE